MLHFILDFETIGQDVFSAPIVNCAYFVFDWSRFTSDKPYTFEELIGAIKIDKFDVKDQYDSGYRYKKRDLQWWEDQGPEALKQLKPSSRDISIAEFPLQLEEYIGRKKIHRWWSRSNTFDPILLHRVYQDYSKREKLDEILKFWLVRDIRTYIDTQFNFERVKNGFCPYDDEAEWNKVFIPHNAVHDVAADILRIQKIERTINT